MQETRSGCCCFDAIIEANGAHITGVRRAVPGWFVCVSSGLWKLRDQMKKSFSPFHFDSLENKHEVAIMYFGRASEFLMMTSECMVIPRGSCTLEQVLNSLRERGDRWTCELDDSHVVCTVNGKAARLFDTIKPGVEINIFSRKSIFEG